MQRCCRTHGAKPLAAGPQRRRHQDALEHRRLDARQRLRQPAQIDAPAALHRQAGEYLEAAGGAARHGNDRLQRDLELACRNGRAVRRLDGAVLGRRRCCLRGGRRDARTAHCRMRHDIVGICTLGAGDDVVTRGDPRRKPFDLAADRAAHFADRSGFLVGPGGHVRQRHIDRPGEQQDVIAKLAGIARRPESRGSPQSARQRGRSRQTAGHEIAARPKAATARNTPPRTIARCP